MNTPHSWLRRQELVARVLGGTTVAIAGLALFGCLSGNDFLTRWSSYPISMAPNTALEFLALGGLLAAGRRTPSWLDRSSAVLIVAVGMARMIEIAVGADLGVDAFWPRLLPSLFRSRLGVMSFFTALSFCLAGLSRSPRLRDKQISFLLNSVVGSIGLTFWLGYVYGNPIHFQGQYIPLAANTALSFLLLGGGQLVWTGAQSRRLRLELEDELRMLSHTLKDQVEELSRTNEQLRAAQGQLIQAEKMSSVGALVAGIAHEVSHPLAFAMNHLDLVQDLLGALELPVVPLLVNSEAKHWNKVRERVRDSRSGLDRVKELLLKLRLFARVDLQVSDGVDVREGLDAVLLLLSPQTEGRIAVLRDYAGWAPVTGNPSHLNQIFLSLLSNAVEAIGGAGTITVTLRSTGEALEILVRDTGCGIDPALLDKIYDPFFTTKPVGAGSGLGLSLAFSIVGAYRGQIAVRSPVDGQTGSEFKVRLPLKQEGQ